MYGIVQTYNDREGAVLFIYSAQHAQQGCILYLAGGGVTYFFTVIMKVPPYYIRDDPY